MKKKKQGWIYVVVVLLLATALLHAISVLVLPQLSLWELEEELPEPVQIALACIGQFAGSYPLLLDLVMAGAAAAMLFRNVLWNFCKNVGIPLLLVGVWTHMLVCLYQSAAPAEAWWALGETALAFAGLWPMALDLAVLAVLLAAPAVCYAVERDEEAVALCEMTEISLEQLRALAMLFCGGKLVLAVLHAVSVETYWQLMFYPIHGVFTFVEELFPYPVYVVAYVGSFVMKPLYRWITDVFYSLTHDGGTRIRAAHGIPAWAVQFLRSYCKRLPLQEPYEWVQVINTDTGTETVLDMKQATPNVQGEREVSFEDCCFLRYYEVANGVEITARSYQGGAPVILKRYQPQTVGCYQVTWFGRKD